MSLIAPNLDDRRFQQLVDDAKRLVQRRCPEWTDHNVSDPGVTLIETFAYMTDMLIYRLNRVPDRHYVKFLELIGVQLYAATAARADVTFWLSAPATAPMRIAAGTEVATPRSDGNDPVGFHVIDPLDIVPVELVNVASAVDGAEMREHDSQLSRKQPVFAFAKVPAVGDTLMIGLSDPAPRCAVTLRFVCDIEGIGVDPNRPPLVWEASTAEGWQRCDLDSDTTGGLNRPGDVVIHIPAGHEASVLGGARAGWVRARVVANTSDQPAYAASPRISSVSAFTIGGTAAVLNAETIHDELIGVSEGIAGQRFDLQRGPIVAGSDRQVSVGTDDGWEEWTEVEHFADSDANKRHFMIDYDGAVLFGPEVVESDGSIRRYGAIPRRGATIRIDSYRVGGGRRGNVRAGGITVLRTSIPFVRRVANRRSAFGGVDQETLDNAKRRGPITMRMRDRAVTLDDYELIAGASVGELARVHAVATDDGGVRVLVVPAVAEDEAGRLRFEQLVPEPALLQRVVTELDERRPVGARVSVEPPKYQGITVVARLIARPRHAPEALRDECLAALYRYFHPISGGPEGRGWPLGRAVHIGEVYSVLQALDGVGVISDVRLFAADPVSGDRGTATQQVSVDPGALVYSYEHQVMVEES